MNTNRFELIEVKPIDMYHFQMLEGKFRDTDQDVETYIYANVSNFDTETFEESEVRIYSSSYEDLVNPEEYELCAMEVGHVITDELKEKLMGKVKTEKDPVLCGFVYCHGEKDLSCWEVNILKEDQQKIEEILAKYETNGSSTRNVWDAKFSDVIGEEY